MGNLKCEENDYIVVHSTAAICRVLITRKVLVCRMAQKKKKKKKIRSRVGIKKMGGENQALKPPPPRKEEPI